MNRPFVLAAALAAAIAFPAGGRLAAQDAQAAPQVDSVEVIGLRRVALETVLNAAGVPLRVDITYRDLQRALRAVYQLGQFDDVQLGVREGAAGEQILLIAVRERPLLERWVVRGAEKVSERQVRERIELPTQRPLDPGSVAIAKARVDSLYEAEGYYLAEIAVRTLPQQDSGVVRLVFDITENRRVAIAQVDVVGNSRFSDEELVGTLRTQPEGFWWFETGEYADARVREDVEARLPGFYGARGFIDFRITRDTLVVEPNTGKATLRIEVDEGRQYRVGTVSVDGNRFFNTDQVMLLNPFGGRSATGLACLFRSCTTAAGAPPFDQAAWDDATNRLRTNYFNEGYIYVDVRPEMERVEAADTSAPLVNLRWLINEQRPAIVNRVEIVGNEVTHEKVIREALFILPGDVFSQERILRSYQAISNLGYFQQPLPFPDTRPANEEGDIDVIFRVEEKHTGSVNFGASVGQGTGVGGFLGLEEPNLFGQGKRGRLQWQFGRNINDFNLSYSDPALKGSRISGTIEAYNSRVRYTVAELGRINSRGFSLQFGFPLPRSRYSRLFLNTGLNWEGYQGASRTINTATLTCRSCLRTILGASVMRDTRIELPFPTGGSMHQVGVTFNGPFNTGTATFQRFDLEGRWYTQAGRMGGTPTVGGIKLVLGLQAKAGFVVGDAGPFFRQLYAMGGTQYGIALRGYDEFSITPAGYNPLASTAGVPREAFGSSYFATTAEFGVRFSQAIYASLFYDAGNVWASATAFNPTRLFRGAGMSIALITPLGPLGLDWAYGFDRTDVTGRAYPGWKLHFRIGNFF